MRGYLSGLIRSGARPAAPLLCRLPLLAGSPPLRRMTADRPVPEARRLGAVLQPAVSPAKSSYNDVSIQPAAERTPPQQTDPALPPVRATLPASEIEKPAPKILAPVSSELSSRHAPVDMSYPVGIELAPPLTRSVVPVTGNEDAVSKILAPVSVELPPRGPPVEISSPLIAQRQRPSAPPVKPTPIPMPRIEFSSSKAPVQETRSLQAASAVTATPSQPLQPPALARALSAPVMTRDFSKAPPGVSSQRAPILAPDSPRSEEPLLAIRSGQPLPSPSFSVRSPSAVRPAEISVREDFHHRRLPTRAPEEPHLIIQRLDVQIINEPIPVHRRPNASHATAAPRAEGDPLRLDRRHVRRLL